MSARTIAPARRPIIPPAAATTPSTIAPLGPPPAPAPAPLSTTEEQACIRARAAVLRAASVALRGRAAEARAGSRAVRARDCASWYGGHD